MGTETPNYMSDEFDNTLPDKERLSEMLSFDPEKEILAISRKFCEPSEKIYKNDPELRKDPLKAIEAINWHGSSLSDIDDPVKGLVVGAAKLNTAENELKLTPKEKEVFSGYKENIHGAIGFLDTLRAKAENKVVRAVASGATIVGMVMGAAGCGDVLAKPIGETPSIPPIVEVSPTPFKPSTPINPTLTVSPKPTETLLVNEGAPYPKSADNLIRSPSISGTEARNKIIEYGAEKDLKALEDWYKKTGVLKTGSSNFLVPVAYEENGNFFWDAMVKSGSGDFIKFTLTSGPEEGELVRAMGMVNYLDTQPSFETSYLSDPPGLAGLNQQIIWDKSGWSVVGAFQGDTLIAWFNADAPNGGTWVKIQELVPAPTLEIPFDISRPETISAADGNSYQGYLIEDKYGTRLVDETNTIILVKEDDAWKPAESRDFSEEYPAVYWETKIGQSDGFEIPITIGLAANVRDGANFNYSKVHINQQGADDVAQVYLHYAWGRYKDIMGHKDITYVDYLDLLKEGKGNLEILDSITHENILIDPRQGVSLVITGDETRNMPLKEFYIGYSFNSSEKGRLLYAANTAYSVYDSINIIDNKLISNDYFVYLSIEGFSLIARAPNKCMRDSVNISCGILEIPSYLRNDNFNLFNHHVDYSEGSLDTPTFTLE